MKKTENDCYFVDLISYKISHEKTEAMHHQTIWKCRNQWIFLSQQCIMSRLQPCALYSLRCSFVVGLATKYFVFLNHTVLEIFGIKTFLNVSNLWSWSLKDASHCKSDHWISLLALPFPTLHLWNDEKKFMILLQGSSQVSCWNLSRTFYFCFKFSDLF